MKNINVYHPRAHFIIIYSSSSVFRNVENLVAILVYSSFIRVATTGFGIIPYSPLVVVVCAQMRSESGITPHSQLSQAAACDGMIYSVNYNGQNSVTQGYALPLFEN